jgi:hypothetical protein
MHHAVRIAAKGEGAATGREGAGGGSYTRSHDRPFYERFGAVEGETRPRPRPYFKTCNVFF